MRPTCTSAAAIGKWLAGWVAGGAALIVAAGTWAADSRPRPAETAAAAAEIVRRAGSAEQETQRYRLLCELAELPELDAGLRADLAGLLPVIAQWAEGKAHAIADDSRAAENGYLCRFFAGKAKPQGAGPMFPSAVAEDSPLYPVWCLYRGRMLIWQVIQSGPLLRVAERREAYYGEARQLLEIAQRAFPANRVIGMYLGQPIPWPKDYPRSPGAPEWANLQREGLEKLTDVIHWWIAQRQLPDGQFGGGWGDDVEMWRWWTPVLVAFDDPLTAAAQERLSSGIFRQKHMQAGFTSRVTDVEHSNEDTTDTILPMLHLRPQDPLWQQRSLHLAALLEQRWTGLNRRGGLQFKSIYFSVDRVDENPGRAYDTVYHPSAVQPALLSWQRTGDPALGKLFGQWLDVWVEAAARAENGKPAGVLPSVIGWPEGQVGAPGRPWWQPFSPGHNDALYNWPGATRLMTSTLLLASHMLDEPRYLEPIHAMAAIRIRHRQKRPAASPEEGSEAWCAKQMGFLSDTLAKYRFLTGDQQYDSLLGADASGYVRFRLSGDSQALAHSLERNAKAFRSNWEAYTDEMRWTDRVISFTRNYLKYLSEPAPPSPTPEILYSTATGDPGSPLIFPLNSVRWLTPPREIAALVTESRRDLFSAELFHFGDSPRSMAAELYLLQPGSYAFCLEDAATGDELVRQALRIGGPSCRISFELPAGKLCRLRVETAAEMSAQAPAS